MSQGQEVVKNELQECIETLHTNDPNDGLEMIAWLAELSKNNPEHYALLKELKEILLTKEASWWNNILSMMPK
jgi:hypothetical protein